MHFRKIMISCVLLCGTSIFSQKPNVFLDREYWKTNPRVTDIKQKIIEGCDISELNSNAFDPVCYALLEKVDNKTIKYLLSKNEGSLESPVTMSEQHHTVPSKTVCICLCYCCARWGPALAGLVTYEKQIIS